MTRSVLSLAPIFPSTFDELVQRLTVVGQHLHVRHLQVHPLLSLLFVSRVMLRQPSWFLAFQLTGSVFPHCRGTRT